jgi:hypothetical protein
MSLAVDISFYIQFYISSLDKNKISMYSQTMPKISLAPTPIALLRGHQMVAFITEA